MSPLIEDGIPDRTVPSVAKVPLVASPAAPDLFGWPACNDRGYRIKEQPMGTKRPMKILVLGAGASGINFLKTAAEKLENTEVVCYEKNADVGGTWFENTYDTTLKLENPSPQADRCAIVDTRASLVTSRQSHTSSLGSPISGRSTTQLAPRSGSTSAASSTSTSSCGTSNSVT
jgi:hypothetical protein